MKENLERVLLRHYRDYPAARPVDMLKLIYQNEFGVGHMIDDPQGSLSRLTAEAVTLPDQPKGPAAEPIGNGLCRLHLRALRRIGLSAATLHRFFLLSARHPRGNRGSFLEKVEVLKSCCRRDIVSFSESEVQRVVEEWIASGEGPFRHSPAYRAAYAPAYRVVEERFCRFLPLFARIDSLLQTKERVIVAIDGNCGAGKTTLAAMVREVYGCEVVSADSFFLRPEQRTKERLAEAGGNLDRERLLEEVLLPMTRGEDFAYRPYDCRTGTLTEPVEVPPYRLYVVEGSYSHHEDLAWAYDLKVFLSVSKEEQMRRITRRNGAAAAERFEKEWIPMEEAYFTAQDIRQKSGLVFEMD